VTLFLSFLFGWCSNMQQQFMNWCNNILFKALWRFSKEIFTKFGVEKQNCSHFLDLNILKKNP